MEERRAVGRILGRLREKADENEAIEADALTKAEVLRKERTAFKKTPDEPLGVVVTRKLARRKELAESGAKPAAHVYPNVYVEDIFDAPYVRTLHKRRIMFQLRYRTSAKRWRANKKKTAYARRYEREEATRWREAILRDAPLLKGFFAEEPQWRDRMLRWCERVLAN